MPNLVQGAAVVVGKGCALTGDGQCGFLLVRTGAVCVFDGGDGVGVRSEYVLQNGLLETRLTQKPRTALMGKLVSMCSAGLQRLAQMGGSAGIHHFDKGMILALPPRMGRHRIL